MGSRGPAPVPTFVLAKRRSWRARSRPLEPRPEPGIGEPPDWLHPNARCLWDTLAPTMVRDGRLAHPDTQTLVRYCDAWARWVDAARFLNRHGETRPVRDRHGRVSGYRPYPQLAQYHRCDRLLGQLGAELGFSPGSRFVAEMDPDGPFGTDPPPLAAFKRRFGPAPLRLPV